MERRATPRFEIGLYVQLTPLNDAEQGVVRGEVQELSTQGMRALVNRSLEDGTLVRLETALFRGTASVTWTHSQSFAGKVSMGLHFLALAGSDQKALDELVQALEKEREAERTRGILRGHGS